MSLNDDMVLNALSRAAPSKGGWYRTNCPFCDARTGKPDRKRAFGILLPLGKFHCFKCGVAGKLRDVPDDIRRLPAPSREDIEAFDPPEGYLALGTQPGCDALVTGPARRYLRSRNLDERLWKEAGIGACLKGKYEGRVIVPILGSDNEWLGFVARAWTKTAERPYLYPKGMLRGEILYNHAALLVETETPVMVVEGVFDSLALWPNAVAVLGKPSGTQIEALAAAKRPVAVVLDGDAHQEGWALAMRLRLMGARAGSVRLPPKVDPDEVEKSWLMSKAIECHD